jgi:hypothetical protein
MHEFVDDDEFERIALQWRRTQAIEIENGQTPPPPVGFAGNT